MSKQMETLYELMLAADAAHKAGRFAEFDILMAEIYDTFDDLPREERQWLISQVMH
jgi:uncharacterized protein HemY